MFNCFFLHNLWLEDPASKKHLRIYLFENAHLRQIDTVLLALLFPTVLKKLWWLSGDKILTMPHPQVCHMCLFIFIHIYHVYNHVNGHVVMLVLAIKQ